MKGKRLSELEKALGILSEAEEDLTTLMCEGLEAQRYDDVAAVAAVTQLLTDLIESLENPAPKVKEMGSSKGRTRKKRNSVARAGPPETKNSRGVPSGPYPRFAKHGDRLVKVGWSRKERQEYEHRAHSKVLWVFAGAVRDRPQATDSFTMEDVLPLVYEGGKEIPSYQAYLALAWLRSVEAITKDGRDGYRADLSKLSDENLKALWKSVSEYV